jgi:hypothetical protein
MAMRTVPYGYKVENGVTVIHAFECSIVQEIFESYLNGLSLKSIAEQLTRREIYFSDGKKVWNKNNIKRILEDIRYLGKAAYPQIIKEDSFSAAKTLKDDKNEHFNITGSMDAFRPPCPVICKKCGTLMIRGHDKRHEVREHWRCGNPECNVKVSIEDHDFETRLKNILNDIIRNPLLAGGHRHCDLEDDTIEPDEVRRLSAAAARMLDSISFDREKLKDLLLNCASEKYKSLSSEAAITGMIKADFENRTPLFILDRNLLEKNARAIQISEDGEICLVLQNSIVIGKEKIQNATGSNERGGDAESRSQNTA